MTDTITLNTIFAQASQLSEEDKLRLVERLIASIRVHKVAEEEDWHIFLDRTYGILANDPIERQPQGDFEVREELE